MSITRSVTYSLMLVTAATLAGSPAEANIGLPMLVVTWPAMWLLLYPIILLEAGVAVKTFHIEFWPAMQIAGVANLVSTLIGLPVTWLLLVLIQMFLVKGGTGVYGLETLRGRILSVTVQCPWLIPYADSEMQWMVPAAELCLCVPFFLMSVSTEYLCAIWFTQGKFQTQDILNWAWTANELSYGMIACIVLAILLGSIWKHTHDKKKEAIVVKQRPVLRLVKDDQTNEK